MFFVRSLLMALAFIAGFALTTFIDMGEADAQGIPRIMPRSMSNFGVMRRPRMVRRWYTATNIRGNQCSREMTGTLQADTGESGQLAAARITPPVTPFRVYDIQYALIHGFFGNNGSDCDAGMAHRVEVYVGNESIPDDDPMRVATFHVDAGDFDPDAVVFWPGHDDYGVYTWRHRMPQGVTLAAGEYLFVAVEMVGERGEVQMCAQWCVDRHASGANTWSFATDPPYAWENLDPYMRWDGDLNVRVRGTR